MNKEGVLSVAEKNNGYLYSKVVKDHCISSSYISRLIKEGKLERVVSGIYVTPETVVDMYYVYCLKYPNIVYSGESALFLNGLSSKQNADMEVTLPYGVNVPEIDNVKIVVSRKATVSLGVSKVETPFGNAVRSYDCERVICDLFIRPSHYDSEDRAFALREYSKHHLNLEKLYRYAKELKVYDEVRNVFEVIAWN